MNTEMPLKKINTSKIVYVNIGDTMLKVEEIFEELPIHHILVLEGTELKGIISKHDLLRHYQHAASHGVIPNRAEVKVETLMTTDPISLDVEDTIGLAADIFLVNKIHSIPIMDGSNLAGIITNHDIIKYCFE